MSSSQPRVGFAFYLTDLLCCLFRSHSDITTLSEEDLIDELTRLEVAMQKILGVKPRLFRPPYGNYNDESLRVLSDRGYSSQSAIPLDRLSVSSS